MDSASSTIPNFTQIQQPCETLQEWQHGRDFQNILKEVGICDYTIICHIYLCVLYRDLVIKS